MDVIYKIKNKEGKFSNGKADPKKHKWVKKGKIWNSLSLVETHLIAVCERKKLKDMYGECDIIVYSTKEITTIDIGPILQQAGTKVLQRIMKT